MTPDEKIEFITIMLIHEMAIHDMVDHADLPLDVREAMVEAHLKKILPEVFLL